MQKTEINIGQRKIGPLDPCFVIAEAGVNHNGDVHLAMKMVDAAADAGADAIKFQTFEASKVASATAPKAAYQLRTTDPSESQQEMLKGLELAKSDYAKIAGYCQEKNIIFLSTAYDIQSLDLLLSLGMKAVKISSTDLTNAFILEAAARSSLPVICSTGMADMDEVRSAVRTLRNSACRQLALLHCVSGYPADPSTINLRAMQSMAEEFGVPVGYSDHTTGIEVPIAAVALGACIIEKHFTLDRKMSGPDHKASCEPDELKALVSAIRKVQSSLGNGKKQPTRVELDNRLKVRRSLAAARPLRAGTILTNEVLTALRPGTGVCPTEIDSVLGKTIAVSLKAGELIRREMLI